MSHSQEKRKKIELYTSNIFIEWLNIQKNSDYICKSHDIENSIVDVIAISKSKRFPDIKIQVTTAESKFEGIKGSKFSAMRKHGDKSPSKVFSFNPQQWILESIEKADGKKERGIENKSEVILLLTAGACIWPHDIEGKKILPAESSFKEVYVVLKPTHQSMHDRPVIQLK